MFIGSKGNVGVKSEFLDTKYEMLDVSVCKENICIVYLDQEKKDETIIKMDLINPNTFQKVKTETLISFESEKKATPYIKVIQSENKEFKGFVFNKNNNDNKLSIYIYNKEMEEVWSTEYTPGTREYYAVGDLNLTNSGKALFQFFIFKDRNKQNIEKILYAELDKQNISEVIQEDKLDYKINDYKITPYTQGQYLVVLTSTEKIMGYKLNFKNNSIDEIFSQKAYYGSWKVDKFMDLKNGKYILALQNRDIMTIIVNQGNGIKDEKFYYWNRSFLFVGINGDNDEITFSKNVGRKYNHMQFYESKVYQVTIEPYYFEKDGNLYVIYNTDKKTEDNVCNSKENPTNLSLYVAKGTLNTITKMIVIDSDGKTKINTLFDSKEHKGTFIPKYAHFDENNDLIIAKSKKKKIAFGIVKF